MRRLKSAKLFHFELEVVEETVVMSVVKVEFS